MPDQSLSTSGSDLTFSAFRLSETGLHAVGTPSIDEWLRVGEFINRSERVVHFWIGDWLNYGEKAWGERYQEAVDRTRFDVQTTPRHDMLDTCLPSPVAEW